ncbi:hypothetical protein B0I35DRAFT_434832 [Stachybotrys elegans]|uniref:RRM domain-containing protein n=1 Tax=Stachybotrys elegans TaxID=80388 RepID=A0A8K0WP10_9HYPO|nr:hypothetical protein B0I35DRAFT_434832 [Stachybotrys elegans]
MAPVAKDFQKIIQDARERKKNEALADKIFSKDRRQSAPTKLKPTPGGSLASRVGVKKQPRAARASLPSGNVNGEWTHDLHEVVNGREAGGSLSSRITAPGAKKANQRKGRIAAALDKMDTDPQVSNQVNIVKKAPSAGMTIKGLAGPFRVMAQNFAPGTSAADIESAMTPIGGEMISVKFVKTSPIVLVEMVFASREGGEQVIDTFNNKTADGRIIRVWAKAGGSNAANGSTVSNPPANAPSGPRGASRPNKQSTSDNVIDGSMGFSDAMETDVVSSSNTRPLYSDRMVAGGNRRGRGFQRGRGGN